MGIDFSHCDASWAYSGFMRFRINLAALIGIDLNSMDGFGGSISWDGVTDPIKPFLHHSDCDGELTPEECRIIGPRLRELLELMGQHTDRLPVFRGPEYLAADLDKGLELARGMEAAAEAGEPLVFS